MVLAHDYLTQRGGAERVVLELARQFPDAPVVTSFYQPEATYPGFGDVDVRPAALSRVPFLRADPRRALPLLAPLFSLRKVPPGVLLASSSGWAHALRSRGPKVVYCHNPARWLYQPHDYFAGLPGPVRSLISRGLAPLRVWDQRAARTAQVYLANSSSVARRVRAAYGIEAEVVHPPSALAADDPQEQPAGIEPGYFLTVGRRRGYKNTELVCAAAAAAGQRLVVVGGLPKRAEPWPDHLVGVEDISDDQLRWLYANCRAVVAMSQEDFGLTPVEGFTFGRPCIALRAGGYLDSCVEGVTGVFVDHPTVAELAGALSRFDERDYDRAAILAHAAQFSPPVFGSRIRAAVDRAVAAGPAAGGASAVGRGRILVVETSLSENGGLRVSLEYARRWQAAGHPTEVAVLKTGVTGTVAKPDASLRVVPAAPPQYRFRYAWPLATLRLIARARAADVVVAGSEVGLCLLFGYVAARIARRPFAVHVQADLDEAVNEWVPRPLRGVSRWVHRHMDAAFCVAESLVDGIVEAGLPRSRAHFVGNGIDVARVRRLAGVDASTPTVTGAPPAAEVAGADPDRVPVIVGSGRLSRQKDFGLLLRAHAKVLASGLRHRVVIMGEGALREELEELAVELGVEDSVELVGFLSNPYAVLAGADLFVLSSRSEGMPLIVIEALAVGVPIIATWCGSGPGMLLADGEFGELVPVGSEPDMVDAIERHLRDPAPLRARAARGPARALDFDLAVSARVIEEHLVELIAARRK